MCDVGRYCPLHLVSVQIIYDATLYHLLPFWREAVVVLYQENSSFLVLPEYQYHHFDPRVAAFKWPQGRSFTVTICRQPCACARQDGQVWLKMAKTLFYNESRMFNFSTVAAFFPCYMKYESIKISGMTVQLFPIEFRYFNELFSFLAINSFDNFLCRNCGYLSSFFKI